MNRRTFLATSPAFFAALALGAKTAGALPDNFPDEETWHYSQLDLYINKMNAHFDDLAWFHKSEVVPYGYEPFFHGGCAGP